MKILKQFIFPVAIVLMGAGAAFATNIAKQSESMLEIGYYKDAMSTNPNECKASPVSCEISGGPVCSWTDPATNRTHTLKRYVNETSCELTLYRGF